MLVILLEARIPPGVLRLAPFKLFLVLVVAVAALAILLSLGLRSCVFKKLRELAARDGVLAEEVILGERDIMFRLLGIESILVRVRRAHEESAFLDEHQV